MRAQTTLILHPAPIARPVETMRVELAEPQNLEPVKNNLRDVGVKNTKVAFSPTMATKVT